MNMIIKNKIPYILIFVGLIYSVSISIFNTLKYDAYRVNSVGTETHSIIRTDVSQYWRSAHEFKTDLENGTDLFKAGGENRAIYLYPKIIGSYFMVIGQQIMDEKNMFVLNNYKFGIPILQSIFYYSLLTLLYFKLKNLFNQRVTIFIIGFLSLEPTIIQFHGSYWTESIYFSFLLLILILLLDLNKNLRNLFFLGLIVGVSFLQRNVSMYLIIPILIYIILCFRKNSFLPLLTCFSGYIIIVLLLGYANYVRSGIYYITPWDQKDAPFVKMAHKLNNETDEIKYEKLNKWISKNNLSYENEFDRRKIADYQHEYFKDALKKNFFHFLQIHAWKSLQSLILDPFTIQNEYTSDKTIHHYWEKYSYQFKYRIPYTIIIYFIVFVGFIRMFKKDNINKNLPFLIFIMISFYTVILGWVGVPRYLVPNLFFLSFCFGVGLDDLIKYINNFKIKKK